MPVGSKGIPQQGQALQSTVCWHTSIADCASTIALAT